MIRLTHTPKTALLAIYFAICMAAFAFGSKALAQNKSEGFNCVELLKDGGLSEPPQQEEAAYFTLNAPEGVDTSGQDPVDPIELIKDLKESEEFQIEDVVLRCLLIIIEFKDKSRNLLEIVDADTSEEAYRLPVLIVLTDNSEKVQNSIERWEEDDYDIPATFRNFENSKHEVRPKDFLRINAFGETKWNTSTIRMVDVNTAPSAVQTFLEGYYEQIMVMCGFGPCHENKILVKHVETAREQAQGDASSTEQADDSAANVFKVTFNYVKRDGTETAKPFKHIERLECILFALSPTLFSTPVKTCPSNAFEDLQKANALLKAGPENHFQIIAGAQFPDVRRFRATLPLGVDGGACQLQLVYNDVTPAERTVPLEPVANSEPAEFSADLEFSPEKVDGKVHLTVKAMDPAACGVRDTDLHTTSAKTLEIALGDQAAKTAILHLLLPRSVQMTDDLGLDEAMQGQFVESVVNAVRGAHSQLSVRRASNIWSVVEASLIALNNDGTTMQIASLNSEILRTRKLVENTFRQIQRDEIENVASNSPSVTSESLGRLLSRAGDDLDKKFGTHRLIVTLIAPIASRNAVNLEDPCTDPLFWQLAESLSSQANIDTKILVFPIVRMLQDDNVDITQLKPINQDILSPSLPSGLYQCTATPAALSIFPYYFEWWRDPVEFAPRYATSLAGGLMNVLDDANTEGGGK